MTNLFPYIMLRNFFFFIVFIPATLVCSLLATLFGYGLKSKRWAAWSGRNWSRATVWSAGLRLHTDLSAMPKDQPVVIMANHSSLLDIPVLYVALGNRTINYVAKQSLFDIPIFGKAMLAAGHVSIDRENRRKAMKSVEQAVQSAQEGRYVVIFPEGTRSTDYTRLQEFKVGGMIIALKTGLPVAPVLIKGTGPILPKGRSTLTPGMRDIHIKALPPIDTSGYTLKDRERFKQDLFNVMQAGFQEMSS